MYMINTSDSKAGTYYFTGEVSSNYGSTTTTKGSGINVYFEESGAGQNMFFIQSNTKQYLSVVYNSGYKFTVTTSAPSSKWTYSTTYSCMVMTANSKICTFGTFGTYTTFAGVDIQTYPDDYTVQFESSESTGATAFATVVNSKITCDSTGTNAPSIASGFSWTAFSNIYANLDGDVSTSGTSKYILKNTSANPSGDTIAQFVARYDYIVGKYGSSTYTDFLGRNPSRLAGFRIPLFESIISKDNSIIIVIISTTITALAVGGYFFFRRKKHGND